MLQLLPGMPGALTHSAMAIVARMFPSALSSVPFHEDSIAITRYAANEFPVHMAVHKISPVIQPPREYTFPHIHHDSDEINIILSEHNLTYRILLDDEEQIVTNNSSIWIPRGMRHAANVTGGSGYFITIRVA